VVLRQSPPLKRGGLPGSPAVFVGYAPWFGTNFREMLHVPGREAWRYMNFSVNANGVMNKIHPGLLLLICLMSIAAAAEVSFAIHAVWRPESHDRNLTLERQRGHTESSPACTVWLRLAQASQTPTTLDITSSTDPEEVQKRCFRCHAWKDGQQKDKTAKAIPSIDVSDFSVSVHSDISCLSCHPDSTRLPHDHQPRVDCTGCHQRHPAKVAHDAHISVSCQACHLAGIDLVRERESGLVLGRVRHESDQPILVHDVVPVDCHRCHFRGNRLGTAVMVLPAKSVLCMPCHPATLSVGDTVTVVSLLVLGVGMVALISVWLSAPLEERDHRGIAGRISHLVATVLRTIFSVKILPVVETLILDAFLQRRLYSQSRGRWFIHALVFYPLVFRFLWGLLALVSSHVWPQWQGTWVMLDRNHPATAFLFDFTGAMVIAGAGIAVVRHALGKSRDVPGLPPPDLPALILLASIFLSGFILEGMRIGMAGSPVAAQYSFLGYAVSQVFCGLMGLPEVYGYMWYCHAGCVGLFVAYLPFSRMMHIFLAPIVLAVRAAAEQ
jgi:nitrate reductase gamma subunit